MSRGRPENFPGLRQKVAEALATILDTDHAKGSPEIKRELADRAEEFGLTDEEVEEIHESWSNYANWAKDHDIIESLGRRKGYRLVSGEEEPTGDTDFTADTQQVKAQESAAESKQHWESYFHLPATLVLASAFRSHIVSLPFKTVSGKWSNPDMIMVRSSRATDDVDPVFEEEVLRQVDSTPPFLVSSIELKYGLGRSRANLLDALTETAINGSWANENWLLFANSYDGISTEFEQDSLEYATDNGIGVAQLVYEHDGENASGLDLIVHVRPTVRHSLRLSPEFDKDGKKQPLANHIVDGINHFKQNGSYRNVTRDAGKLAELLKLAFENLSIQPGFVADDGIDQVQDLAQRLFTANPNLAADLNQSILEHLPMLFDETSIENPRQFLAHELQ